VVTDMTGQRLDFGHGAKLLKNTGVVSVIIPMKMSEWYESAVFLCSFFFPRFFNSGCRLLQVASGGPALHTDVLAAVAHNAIGS
jgi:hypothetical protein